MAQRLGTGFLVGEPSFHRAFSVPFDPLFQDPEGLLTEKDPARAEILSSIPGILSCSAMLVLERLNLIRSYFLVQYRASTPNVEPPCRMSV